MSLPRGTAEALRGRRPRRGAEEARAGPRGRERERDLERDRERERLWACRVGEEGSGSQSKRRERVASRAEEARGRTAL